MSSRLIKNKTFNSLYVKDARLMSFMALPCNAKAFEMTGEIMAKGEGTVRIELSTCAKNPDDLAKGKVKNGFSADKTTTLGTFTLTGNYTAFKFKHDVAPYEQGYMYLHVKGNAEIEHVNAALIQK